MITIPKSDYDVQSDCHYEPPKTADPVLAQECALQAYVGLFLPVPYPSHQLNSVVRKGNR